MALQSQTQSEHNISAGRNNLYLSFFSLLPPSPLYPPSRLTCAAFTCMSVCPAPCLAICVCWLLVCFVFFSLLHHTVLLPCFLSPHELLLFSIYIPALMCPLSAVLVLTLFLSSTSSSWYLLFPQSAFPSDIFFLCTFTQSMFRES